MPPYLLLDGYSLAFRAWFALQEADLVTASGQQTQAVYGFAGMLARLLEDHSPAGMAVAFDTAGPTFRDAMDEAYKAGRSETPEPLREQFGLIRQMIETIGVPVVELAGYEADDVIATLATRLEVAGEDVVVVSGDRDTYQLVRDPHVKVLYNRRGVTDYVLYDEAGIVERTGVRPELYPMLAALRGDPSDNLPGVPGVGEKTAAKLTNTYLDLDELFAHVGDQPPKLAAALAENEPRVRQNFALIPLVRDVPVDCDLALLRFGRSDRAAMASLFGLLEIRVPKERIERTLDRLEVAGGTEAAGGSPPDIGETIDLRRVDLGEPEQAARWLEALDATASSIAVESAWQGAPGRSELEGLGFARLEPVAGGEALAGADPAGGAELAEIEVGFLPGRLIGDEALRAVLASIFAPVADRRSGPPGRVVTHRAKEIMRALGDLGVGFDGLDLDVAVAGYLADPRHGQASLDSLAEKLSVPSPRTGAIPGAGAAGAEQLGFALDGGTGTGTEEALAEQVASRVGLLVRLAPLLRRALSEGGARRLYEEVERPLIGVLARMELAGIAVDRAALEAINSEMTSETHRLEVELQRLAGEEFNVNSTPQLRQVLFDRLGLAPQKRTKTGYSTDAQSLEKMRGAHPIVDTLLAYREVEKLRSTYGVGLLSEVGPDGRIHASFNQTVARTGRLSSDQPNLHNIPVRSDLGRRFRQAFVPAEGCELLVADYDQIELRVIAHLARDPGLVEAFRAGEDIHEATAARIFGVEPKGVTVAMRSKAKMVSYGLAYGMEAYGLSQRLSIPVEEAAEILAQYFAAFPKVKEYMARTVADARARGYTETLFGRRRYIPELDSANYRVRQAAERQAMNAGIQGLAADIFKVALVRIDSALSESGLEGRLVLQVHDEVIVESRLAEGAAVAALVSDVMEHACELSVPLSVHVARGDSWADAKAEAARHSSDDEAPAFLLAEDGG
ncbi:MAG: DNA polymerase I [Acidimicrobiales bacterium]